MTKMLASIVLLVPFSSFGLLTYAFMKKGLDKSETDFKLLTGMFVSYFVGVVLVCLT